MERLDNHESQGVTDFKKRIFGIMPGFLRVVVAGLLKKPFAGWEQQTSFSV